MHYIWEKVLPICTCTLLYYSGVQKGSKNIYIEKGILQNDTVCLTQRLL